VGEPSPEIARLADVEQPAGGVVQAIDARLPWNSGEKVRAKLLVEDPHAPLSPAGVPIHEAFVTVPPGATQGCGLAMARRFVHWWPSRLAAA